MTSENACIKYSLKTPPEVIKKVGYVKPRVIIPPSQGHLGTHNACGAKTISSGTKTPQNYGRKASVFIFERLNGFKDFTRSGLGIGEKCSYWLYNKVRCLSRKWFTHCFLTIIIFIYTVGGALVFLTVEGQNETKLIEHDINLEMTKFLKDLRIKSIVIPKQFSDKEWKGEAARRIVKFEKKITKAFDQHPLVVSNTGEKVWTIWNAIVYCATLYTTIGYGHIYPTTFTGRVLTIVYSTIGIPLFLIALTDFGKLFTRGIKFVWAIVRRLYFTGSCRKVRKTTEVQDIFKGAKIVYEIATFRRPAMFPNSENSPKLAHETKKQTSDPQTPAISNFEVDDEFNLPISLALSILVTYIFCGAIIYMFWEDWDFFASFYFVFISMSTVGFGDYVPKQPIGMIVSILYLCFGLALMTMCINVVQDKLNDTITNASTNIGVTIGLEKDKEGYITTMDPQHIEIPRIHNPINMPETRESEIYFE